MHFADTLMYDLCSHSSSLWDKTSHHHLTSLAAAVVPN